MKRPSDTGAANVNPTLATPLVGRPGVVVTKTITAQGAAGGAAGAAAATNAPSPASAQSAAPAAAPAAIAAAPSAKAPGSANDGAAALLALLKVEADARDATSLRDLKLIAANEVRKLTRARQIFVMEPGLTGAYEVQAISSVPGVDRNAPLVVFIERLVASAAAKAPLTAARALDISDAGEASAEQAYPFRALMWLPLQHGARPAVGGLLLAREDAWVEQDLVVAQRLSASIAHAWAALQPPKRKLTRQLFRLSRWHAAAAVAAILALLFIKVPLSALAPVEIIARDPFVVSAPLDGVIESVLVEPNQAVKTGDLLVKIADTTLKNRLEVAEREVQVAEARLKQAHQVAFSDPRGMHEIGIARAELSVKMAERDFARDLLAKSEIRAQRDGIAVYSDKRDLVGRPVAIGERMLEVANASNIDVRIDLPVADAIALTPGARARVFLDSDPLTPWPAAVTRADYKAKVSDSDVVAFRVIAALEPSPSRPLPRLGVRGTALISGDNVALGLYLFRRPITALRQRTGF